MNKNVIMNNKFRDTTVNLDTPKNLIATYTFTFNFISR